MYAREVGMHIMHALYTCNVCMGSVHAKNATPTHGLVERRGLDGRLELAGLGQARTPPTRRAIHRRSPETAAADDRSGGPAAPGRRLHDGGDVLSGPSSHGPAQPSSARREPSSSPDGGASAPAPRLRASNGEVDACGSSRSASRRHSA